MKSKRLGFAATLGAALGLTVAYFPTAAPQAKGPVAMELASGAQRTLNTPPSPVTFPFEVLAIGLLVGLALAVPVFLLAKRRL
jgi:hypothetical protein